MKRCETCERAGACDIEKAYNGTACMLHKEKGEAVNHPSHYNSGGVECIDGIKAATGDGFKGFLAGNVMKYIWRYQYKNGAEDVEKAIWYAQRLLSELKGDGNA